MRPPRRWLARAALTLVLALPTAGSAAAPAEYRRPPEQTYLTFPEWYLVHSPAEYAGYLQSGAPPSGFPLFAHIGQFWQGYAAMTRETERYPFNGGYHLMVMVIGASTTIEYGIKGLYEQTVGRLAEASRGTGPMLPEERFAARYARDYVDFIRVDPWYQFDFFSRLRQLWQGSLPLDGNHPLRRWERRYLLSSELLAKGIYGQLIKLATRTVYDEAKPQTAVVLRHAPPASADRRNYIPQAAQDGLTPALLPRYQAFQDYSLWLARNGADFQEIAGNRGEILISLLAPDAWRAPGDGRLLLEQPILTQPGRKRALVAVPVGQLAGLLRLSAAQAGVDLEHVYDY
ncbi:hypothetical protein KIF53_13670 [Chromobacterium subtsugae]|uniref:Uncharacterized protein n=1 Tax=Chromobacterium subtsugae TaxID=251747 RepID=A0ABS7FF23_9NEIS|nr:MULTISPECIES: hypothetical protein [Chromobacterium]KUM03456.1 hypothetical protein Cv017_18980 [Chromobacterium subtsugae]KZE87624.1 hypothetical protein AWB61_10590 [Chromobacterium sp. F49]MBW7567003.1 hypothetical protein [Chromobacterium subtsugae]MBW8288678.1 hypothetical protein [Chromobacterium subtsugae]WSE90096.1 hypothetical protein U6115_14490 [Chromobacterium subtsugae]